MDIEIYDVTVVGGGIGGSIAARILAKHGFKTLLIERLRTPRNKPCSGIQFPYFEKLVGEKIPGEKLCTNELFRVEMIMPGGDSLKGRMKMLNFWRSTFDSWLNTLAVDAGADFRDESKLLDFNMAGEQITVKMADKSGEREINTRYLIGADGLNSTIRKKLRPQDFKGKKAGGTINYYFTGGAGIDPNTLYMFYNREFAPIMFAWVYLKDDQWVIGTGADKDLLQYAERFLGYIREKYNVRGEMIKREGFASPMESGVYLGETNVLMVGDAAGLVDLHRGLGMDNAALSGRLAAKAIMSAEETGCSPIESYQRLMRKTVRKVQGNAKRQAARYATNKSLENSLSRLNLIKGGLLMVIASQINKILPPERIIMLPL